MDGIDAGMAAGEYAATNKFYEGSLSGDFGDVLEDYDWDSETYQFPDDTNVLRVDLVLRGGPRDRPPETISILVFDANFQSTPFGGAGAPKK